VATAGCSRRPGVAPQRDDAGFQPVFRSLDAGLGLALEHGTPRWSGASRKPDVMLRTSLKHVSHPGIARAPRSVEAALLRDERGVAMLEYSILIGSIAIAGSLGLVAVGVALVRSYDFAQALLLSPVP
jgi:Flp pilus assembly pilin Flp